MTLLQRFGPGSRFSTVLFDAKEDAEQGLDPYLSDTKSVS